MSCTTLRLAHSRGSDGPLHQPIPWCICRFSKLYNILSMKVRRSQDCTWCWQDAHPSICVARPSHLTSNLQEFQRRGAGSGIEHFAAQPGIAKTEIFGKIDQQPGKPVGTGLVNTAVPCHESSCIIACASASAEKPDHVSEVGGSSAEVMPLSVP